MAVSIHSQIEANKTKTWLVMGFFILFVTTVTFVFAKALGYGSSFGLLALVAASITGLGSYFWGDKLVLSISRAKQADRKKDFDFYTVCENMAIAAGIPTPKLYVIEDTAINAFATGRDPKHAVVAVTTGLLQRLDRSELEGVLAHELSHIGNRDILVMTVAVVLAGIIAIVADIFLRMSFFGGGSRESRNPLVLIAGIAAIILAPIAAQLIQLAVSRRREFLADASGALLTRYPDALASALQKISSYAAPMKKANHATAHLFISNPFGAHEAGRFVAKLFSTHPPVEERVAALTQMRI